MKRCEPGRFAIEKGEDRLELAIGAEAVATQIRLGRDDRVRRPLEDCKSPDQAKQQRAVIRRREPDFDPFCHVGRFVREDTVRCRGRGRNRAGE